MGRVAEEIQKAWDESSHESGFHTPEEITRYKAEKARESFYRLFFKKTGLHDSLVRGLFNDWCKLDAEEAISLAMKHNVKHSFCAYLAEYIENRTATAGISTAYHHDLEENIKSELH
jgi:hypothetical protein